MVVWTSYGSSGADSSDSSIQGRHYDNSGMPAVAQFQINTHTNSWQNRPAVAAERGNFVVVWQSLDGDDTDTYGWRIQGQRYASPWPIFADGLESGDTSEWSNTVQ